MQTDYYIWNQLFPTFLAGDPKMVSFKYLFDIQTGEMSQYFTKKDWEK